MTLLVLDYATATDTPPVSPETSASGAFAITATGLECPNLRPSLRFARFSSMVTVDKALETQSAVNAYTAQFFSKRYGVMETRSYDTAMIAKRQATKVVQQEADYDGYEIYEWDVLIHAELYGYDVHSAIQDLRTFRNCCRSVIAGWECATDGFRLLVEKGYIVPAENHLEHTAGYWQITERFRKVGNYLVKRRWW